CALVVCRVSYVNFAFSRSRHPLDLHSFPTRRSSDLALVQQVPDVPDVTLASAPYKLIDDFEPRFPHGIPSLKTARSLDVQGDWTFGADVTVYGDAVLGEEGGEVPGGARVGSVAAD